MLVRSPLSYLLWSEFMCPSRYTQPRQGREGSLLRDHLFSGSNKWLSTLVEWQCETPLGGTMTLTSLLGSPRQILPPWCSEPAPSRSKGSLVGWLGQLWLVATHRSSAPSHPNHECQGCDGLFLCFYFSFSSGSVWMTNNVLSSSRK